MKDKPKREKNSMICYYVRNVGIDLGYDDMCIVLPDGLSGGFNCLLKKLYYGYDHFL